MLNDLKRRSDADLEALHHDLLDKRDRAHNALQNLNRNLDAVRRERMRRSAPVTKA